MTWKDLKEKIERAGLKDDDEILFIDIMASEEIVIKNSRHGLKEIYSH